MRNSPSNGPDQLFSIVVPTYNRSGLLRATLDSIAKQEYQNFEALIVDDGGTDDTERVVNELGDRRFSYFRKENGERGAARNFGATKAKGTYINFFDSDDVMYPFHLTEAARMVADHDSPPFFHLGYDHKLEDGTRIGEINVFNDATQSSLLFENKLSCNGVFIRKDITVQFPFREDRMLASSEDWELWIRLSCRFKLPFSNRMTTTVIDHGQRSLRTIPADRIVKRDELLIRLLQEDPEVMKTYGSFFGRFKAERYTFFMLSFAASKQRMEVIRWARRALYAYPWILFTKRFLASIKNMIVWK